MQIGTLGAGEMTAALGQHWTARHAVLVAGRTPAKARALAEQWGAEACGLREAAESSEVILLAVRWEGVEGTLTEAGADDGTLAGKVLIDCCNPVEVDRFTLTTDSGVSLAQRVAQRTGARVVKAFNLCHASVWAAGAEVDGHQFTVPLAGDDSGAVRQVASLAEDVGARPVHVGGLEQAGHLEATAAMVIRLLFGGADLSTTFELRQPRTTP